MARKRKQCGESWRDGLLARYLNGENAEDVAVDVGQSLQVVRAFFRAIRLARGDVVEGEESGRVKVLHTIDGEMKEWLEHERKRTGRSVSFMIELALRQWRDRIERGRKND